MATAKDEKQFIGKIGRFCPMTEGGGVLLREKDGEFHAASGSKGYLWLEAEMVRELGKEEDIDMSYFQKLVDAAKDKISQFGDFERFTS